MRIFTKSKYLVVVNGSRILRLQVAVSKVGCRLTEVDANCSFGVWEVSIRNSISNFFLNMQK